MGGTARMSKWADAGGLCRFLYKGYIWLRARLGVLRLGGVLESASSGLASGELVGDVGEFLGGFTSAFLFGLVWFGLG